MDFFERQDRARRRTSLLVFYFLLAVVLIAAGVYFSVVLAFKLSERPDLAWWQPEVLLYAVGGVLLVIGGGSLFKILELRQGGRVVAETLGGRTVGPAPTDLDEQKLRNVVEEMAIASGTPVPEIYVLEQEQGINAFAAGHTPADAAIGVTRGAIRRLSRDELQGVIAHEFSHILNGDMRLNLRLIGILFGILCLAVIGRILLRVVTEGSRGSRSRKKGGAVAGIFVLGLALMVLGYIGLFFGRLIKAAISRQREFLADAAAVQFTRNPEGLAGALKKIGGLVRGSWVRATNAEEASHLFFADGMVSRFTDLFSTHPPLAERIRAIDPSFDGTFLPSADADVAVAEPGLVSPLAPMGEPPRAVTVGDVVAQVGTLSAANLRHAAAFIGALPREAVAAIREPPGAIAAVAALLLSRDEATRSRQMALVQAQADPAVWARLPALAAATADLERSFKIPLVDLALPALRCLSRDQYARFGQLVRELIESDQEIDLFEYTLERILRRHLEPFYTEQARRGVKYRSVAPVGDDCAVLLSALAHLGQEDPAEVSAAFEQGCRQLDVRGMQLQLLEYEQCSLAQVDQALDRLAELAPVPKRNVLFACAHTVAADQKLEPREAELLRAIADSLDCPMPPFLDRLVQEMLPAG